MHFMKYIMASCAGLICASFFQGCFTIEDAHSRWVENSTPIISDGPGSCRRISRIKYQTDVGDRISVGFFPGCMEIEEKGKLSCGYKMESPADPVLVLPFFNAFTLFYPTVEGLFLSPFGVHAMSEAALVGMHRWKSSRGSRRTCSVDTDYDENVVVKASGDDAKSCATILTLPDEECVWSDYPGFQKIYSVAQDDKPVGVLFEDGSMIRKFKISENDSTALAYEDVEISSSLPIKVKAAADSKRLSHELLKTKNAIESYRGDPEYAILQKEITGLIDQINKKASESGLQKDEVEAIKSKVQVLLTKIAEVRKTIDERNEIARKNEEAQRAKQRQEEARRAEERWNTFCGIRFGSGPEELGVNASGGRSCWKAVKPLAKPFRRFTTAELLFGVRTRRLYCIVMEAGKFDREYSEKDCEQIRALFEKHYGILFNGRCTYENDKIDISVSNLDSVLMMDPGYTVRVSVFRKDYAEENDREEARLEKEAREEFLNTLKPDDGADVL